MNAPTRLKQTAIMIAVTAPSLLMAENTMSACAHPCATSPIVQQVRLRVIVPDTLTFNSNALNNQTTSGIIQTREYSRSFSAATGVEQDTMTYTLSKP